MKRFSQFAFVFIFALPAFAEMPGPITTACGRIIHPLTYQALDERWQPKLAEIEKEYPARSSTDILKEANNDQPSFTGLKTFQDMLGPFLKFTATPSPSSPFRSMVHFYEGKSTFPADITLDWYGRKTSTTLYISLPKDIRPPGPSGRIISRRDYPAVLFFQHGGGTATSSGKNGMSVGQALERFNIPVIAMDNPGHGRGPASPNGFERYKQKMDYMMAVADKTVDPDVDLFVAGHSWGGEDAVYAWMLSLTDPKYKRIKHLIALAPPVDVSKGTGDTNIKAEFERWFDANFQMLKDRSAPKDFEFLMNIKRNGKDADIPGMFCVFTDNDYCIPRFTPEQQAQMTPLTVMIPRGDLLTYVGREEYAEANFGNLVAPHKLIYLDEGYNFQYPDDKKLNPLNKKAQPGHGSVFDIYAEGTTTPVGYKLLSDTILSYIPGGQIEGDPPKLDKRNGTLKRAFIHYARDFAAQQMIEGLVVHASRNDQSNATFAKDLSLSKSYVKKNEDRARTAKIELDLFAESGLVTQMAKARGINENLKIDRIRRELAFPPLTAERKKVLDDYIAAFEVAEKSAQNSVSVPEADAKLAAIKTEFSAVLTRLNLMEDISRYAAVKADFEKRKKKLTDEERADYAVLSRMQQRMSEYNDLRAKAYNKIRDERVNAVPKPEGVEDIRSARWEANPARGADRTAKLQDILDHYDEAVEAERVRRDEKFNADIANDPKRPAGVVDVESGKQRFETLSSLSNFTYVPPNHPEIAEVVKRIQKLNQDRIKLGNEHAEEGLTALEDWVQAMYVAQDERSALYKAWNGAWAPPTQAEKDAGKQEVSSPAYAEAKDALEGDYETMARAKDAFKHRLHDEIRRLHRGDNMTEERLLDKVAGLRELQQESITAERIFMTNKAKLEVVRMEESITGQLTGDAQNIETIRDAAAKLFGGNYPDGTPNSVVGKARKREETVERLRRGNSIIMQQLDIERTHYTDMIAALPAEENPYGVPNRFSPVNITSLLSQGYEGTLAAMERSENQGALDQTVMTLDGFMPEIYREAQSKDPGNL